MQTMTSLEREAWGIFFKVFQAMRKASLERKTTEDKVLSFICSELFYTNNPRLSSGMPAAATWELGRYDKIVCEVYSHTVQLKWFYQYGIVANLFYDWGKDHPSLTVYSGNQYTEATRTRLCAALKITNGWTIHARKEGQRRQWYLTSDYLPFPTTKEKLAEYKEKQYIKTFSEGMPIPIAF